MSTPQYSARPGPQNNLQTQMLSRAFIGIVIPVALLGSIAFWVLSILLDGAEADFARSRGAIMDSVAGRELLGRARSTAWQVDSFFVRHITEAMSWAAAPVIVGAARAAHERHVAEGFTEADVRVIEDRFRDAKSLGTAPATETYLRRAVSASPYFTEIFFTDRNGFNVALTNSAGDFIQSDEDWWKDAWSQGIAIGEFERDDSAGTWSVPISVRLADPATQEPVGVMRAVLAIEPIQKIADRTAEAIPGGLVWIVTKDGVLIAEAASGQDRGGTANRDVISTEQEAVSLVAEGFAVHEDWLIGHARTGRPDTYAPIAARFSGFDWVVVVQQPVATVYRRIPALDVIDDTLRNWQGMLAIGTVSLVLCWIATTFAFAVGTARRYSDAIKTARELAESAEQGKTVSVAEIEHPREIAQLYDAVKELSRVYLLDRRESRQQR